MRILQLQRKAILLILKNLVFATKKNKKQAGLRYAFMLFRFQSTVN